MPSVAQLEALLAKEPNDPFVLYGLAQEHAKQGDHARAVEFYDRCLAVDPNYHYAYFHKAMTLRQRGEAGDEGRAIETLRAGLVRARAGSDAKAASEIAGLLDEMT